ncbi:MAG: T9SS type A sorting domain-containing protein [bacterium]
MKKFINYVVLCALLCIGQNVTAAPMSSNDDSGCTYTSTDAAEGTFTTGYTLSFEQDADGSVTVTVVLLDTDLVGLVANLYDYTSGSLEVYGMTDNGNQTFSYTFSSVSTNSISCAVQFPYADGGLIVTSTYSCDVVASTGDDVVTTVSGPTEAATAPTHDAANVVSVYSDVYTQGVTGFSNAVWGILANYTTIGTDNLFSIDFSTGYQFAFTFTSIDLSAMEYLYFDCWVETAQQMNVGLIATTGGDSRAKTVDLVAGWNQVSIPLTYFTESDGVGLDLWGVKLYTTTNLAVAGLLPYVDNIIFYKSPVVDNNVPTMGEATFVSATYNTATITVASTDVEEAECNYYVMNGTTELGTFTATEGQITVTGLTAETAYSLDIYAKDLGLNVSANFATVTFTTTVRTDAPTTSATTPTKDAANVYSFFSDTYTTSATSFVVNADWGQPSYSTYYPLEVATGDNVAVYPTMTYQGITFDAVNALAYDYIHIDIWMEEAATITFYPICQTDAYSLPLTIVGGQWNSFDLSVEDFTNLGLEMGSMKQFKLDNGLGANVFMDNLYLWREPIADDEIPTDLAVTVGDITYKSIALDLYAKDNSGTVSYTITYGEGLTATAGGSSDATATTTISGLTASTEYIFSVVAYDVNNNTTDAVSVTATTSDAPAGPAESAPVPTYAAENVMSVYSDTYEQTMGYNVGSWGQSTSVESYAIGEDNIMMLSDFNYLGLEFWSTHDLSNYANLHFDVWAETMTSIQVTPIGSGETLNTYTLDVNSGWNSVDFASSVFTAVDFSQINQMKFAGGSGSDIVYIDNIYFYNTDESATTNVDNTTVSTSVVYPNPATDFMIVEAESTIEMVTVYSIMGQAVSSTVGGGQSATISVAGLSVGNYIVRVQTADGNISMHKLIKK